MPKLSCDAFDFKTKKFVHVVYDLATINQFTISEQHYKIATYDENKIMLLSPGRKTTPEQSRLAKRMHAIYTLREKEASAIDIEQATLTLLHDESPLLVGTDCEEFCVYKNQSFLHYLVLFTYEA